MTIMLIIVAIVLLGLAFAGIAIKMLFHKNAEFHKPCSSMDAKSGKRLNCSCYGNTDSAC